MTPKINKNLNYPFVISVAIHGVIIAFFSLWHWSSPEKISKKTPIHIKKIIFEKRKAAPPKKQITQPVKRKTTSQKKQITKSQTIFKPAAAENYFHKRPSTTSVRPKSLTQNSFNTFTPTTFISGKTSPLKKYDLKPKSPALLVAYATEPITPAPNKIDSVSTHSQTIRNIQPRSFSENFSTSAQRPASMVSTVETFPRKPFGRPLQVASIPKNFITELGERSVKSLESQKAKAVPGTNNGIPDSSGHDLNTLRKGYSSQVWARVANAKFYPRIARKRGMEGKPVVEFELRSDGQLMNYFIALSSSSKILDKAAMDAVKNGSPYPDIPKPLKLESIRFKLPISFILSEP
ncbi:MAG: energy transducer TonB [Nitrospinae bacterium]|nr:energy transducer TonB [Nitrospinota bacterium]